MLTFEGEKEIKVSRGYLQTRKPSTGGYYIRHASGEELFLSEAAFESRFELADDDSPAEAPLDPDE